MRATSRIRSKARARLASSVAAWHAERTPALGDALAAAALEVLAKYPGAGVTAPELEAAPVTSGLPPCDACGTTGGRRRYDGLCAPCSDRASVGASR